MNQSREMMAELMEAFADLPHILSPQEKRPYFDKAEAELVSRKLTEDDGQPRTVNHRVLDHKEVRNRFPLGLLPVDNHINWDSISASALHGPDGTSHAVDILTTYEHYWIDRVE